MNRGQGRGSFVGFAEVPDFHIEVVRRDSPALASRPLLVGGDPTKRGRVVAASPDLRARGIVEGMGLDEALERAPEAHRVRTDIQRAREVSGLLRATIRREVGAVEIEGLAGFYLRVPADRDAARTIARRLAHCVREDLGLPLRFGAAPPRFVARMAAEDAGIGGVRVIGPEELDGYLLEQPIGRFPGVGPKTAARLAELGATDVPGLRRIGRERLEILLGNPGRSLWQLASGQDPRPLRLRRHPATLSREESLPEAGAADSDRSVRESVREGLLRLATSLEQALRRDGLEARRVALRLTRLDGRPITRSRSLDQAIRRTPELVGVAESLWARADSDPRGIRRICIILRGLEVSGATDQQLDLF